MHRLHGAADTAEQWACVVSDTNPDFRAYLVVWRARSPAIRQSRLALSHIGPVIGWRTVARPRSGPDEIAAAAGGVPLPESATPCARFGDTDLAAVTVVLIGHDPEHAVYEARALPVGVVATAGSLLPVARKTDFPWQTFAGCLCIRITAKRRQGQDGWEWQLGRGTLAPDRHGTLGRCLAAPGCTVLIHPAGSAAPPGWSGKPAKPVETALNRTKNPGAVPPIVRQAMAMPQHLHPSDIGRDTQDVGVPIEYQRRPPV